jgi:hypothetical protein
MIFAPWGTSLVLHTHTALPAFAGATLLQSIPIVTAQNVVLWIALAANAIALFALAWDRTRDRVASAAGAFIFAASPFLAAHLHGHWNLVHLWPLPLTALLFGRAAGGRRLVLYSALTAVVLVAALYTDYYITVFAAALVAAISAQHLMAVELRVSEARVGPAVFVLAAFVACAFAGAIWVALSGGGVLQVGPLTIVARSPTNLSRAGWIGVGAVAVAVWRPRLRWSWSPKDRRQVLAALGVVAVILIASGSPILWRAARLVQSGEYVSQQYRWRSAPKGIDLLSLVAGNPQSPIYGDASRGLYASLAIDPVEQIGWLGITPLVLAACALRDRRDAARWAWLLAGTVVWAMGPFLNVAGKDVGLPLPQLLQRFIPILSNARIPGRAMALAYLALAMLGALGLAALRARRPETRVLGRWLPFVVTTGLLIDFWPAPFPVTVLAAPPLYEALAGSEKGTIGELPLGLRDGFGEVGQLDHLTIYYQTVHGRPVLGGFVARLSPTLRARYEDSPIISSLLMFSSGETPSASALARDRVVAPRLLREWRLETFVVRKKDASPALKKYLTRTLGAHVTVSDDERDVYVVP